MSSLNYEANQCYGYDLDMLIILGYLRVFVTYGKWGKCGGKVTRVYLICNGGSP
jgi:hypothetical protein